VVLDLSLPELAGTDAIREIRAELPSAEVAVFSMHEDELFVGDWAPTPQAFQLLNEALGTDVCLVNGYLEDAKFPDESFDRVISVSVFEHIAEPALATILAEIRRVLKPGGLAVMTVDLFLDVQPFAPAASNAYGHNVSVKWIVETSGLDLVGGRRAEAVRVQPRHRPVVDDLALLVAPRCVDHPIHGHRRDVPGHDTVEERSGVEAADLVLVQRGHVDHGRGFADGVVLDVDEVREDRGRVVAGPVAPGELRVQLLLAIEERGADTHRRQGYPRPSRPAAAGP